MNSIFENCVNLKHVKVRTIDSTITKKSKLDLSQCNNRNISKIEHLDFFIDSSNIELDLRSPNLYNLTTLNIKGFNELCLNNFTSNIQNLKIDNYSISIIEKNLLEKLPKLKSLECSVASANELIQLFKINSIEKLKIIINDVSNETPDIDLHSMTCQNLKYLYIYNDNDLFNEIISKISGFNFPNLEYLELNFNEYDDELKLTKNSSLSNLKTLKLNGLSDNSIKSIFESKYFANVTNLKLQSTTISSDILLYFIKSKLFQNLERFVGYAGESLNGYEEFFQTSKLKSLKKLAIYRPNNINDLLYLAKCKILTNLEYLNVPFYDVLRHSIDFPDNFFQTLCENEISFQNLKELLIPVTRDEQVHSIINSHLKRVKFEMYSNNFNVDTFKLLAQNNIKPYRTMY